jgi:DNA invertase Pin-like site-specific DNA recombinase
MKREDSKIISQAMKILRSIPSEKRAAASRENGRRNPFRKLAPGDHDRIRDSYQKGVTAAELADWFEVNTSLIYRILNKAPSVVAPRKKRRE